MFKVILLEFYSFIHLKTNSWERVVPQQVFPTFYWKLTYYVIILHTSTVSKSLCYVSDICVCQLLMKTGLKRSSTSFLDENNL